MSAGHNWQDRLAFEVVALIVRVHHYVTAHASRYLCAQGVHQDERLAVIRFDDGSREAQYVCAREGCCHNERRPYVRHG